MSTSTSGSPEYEISWISEFCSKRRNTFFCEVSEFYILDSFNLVGLEKQVHYYAEALHIILSRVDSDVDDTSGQSEALTNVVNKSAEILYGLIHARYILTVPGIAKMFNKYYDGDFGYCPRVYCNSQKMLPIGLSDIPGQHYVKIYCPKCMEVYKPVRSKHIDGAFFGTGFPHMFFMVLPEHRPKKEEKKFVPRLFGFQIHSCAYKLQEAAAAGVKN